MTKSKVAHNGRVTTLEARVVDLDAKRLERDAARAEAKQAPVVVRLGGKDFPLPAELPLEAIEALAALERGNVDGIRGSVESILGEEHWPHVEKLGLSLPDAIELLQGVCEMYGVDVGESPASSGS